MAKSLKILYLGSCSGTCLDRANALRRLGHDVEHIDLRLLLPKSVWVDRLTWRFGGDILSPLFMPRLNDILKDKTFNFCWIDGGEWINPKGLSTLRQYTQKIVNYCIDDPLGYRDGARYKAYRKSLSSYDLCVVMRDKNVNEAITFGAKNVIRVFMSADEIAHRPRTITQEDFKKWSSEVLFLGTFMPERGSFLLDLINLGLPLTIRGSNWHKAREWPKLKRYWAGSSISGDDYAKAIQCAKVNLGMLSKGNRDMHTTRSLEIPALGGLFCAERTEEHSAMYIEGEEALFWSDAKECVAMCNFALSNDDDRKKIANAGYQRSIRNRYFNETMLAEIIAYPGFVYDN